MFVIESHWRLSGLKNDTRMANTKTNIVLVSGNFCDKKICEILYYLFELVCYAISRISLRYRARKIS